MRIAFLIDTVEPFYVGGYEKRAFELARRLAKRHEIFILTSAPDSRTIDGIRFVSLRPRVPTFNAHGYRSVREALLFAKALAFRSLRADRFDIVDCNATPFLHIPSAWLFARRSGARLVLTVHEALLDQLEPYLRERQVRAAGLAASVLRRGYMTLHSLPDAIVACSEETARRLHREGTESDGITHGGVASLGTSKGEYSGRLVTVARLVPPKRISVTIEAFAVARHLGHASQLTIVGDGPERETLARLIDRLGLGHCARIAAGVSETEKQEILTNGSDLYVSASLREGLSIATLEALGAGLPAIISNRPTRSMNGAVEYILDGANGFLTDGTMDGIANAVARVATDPHTYRDLSAGAIASAKRYTWDEATDELESIYRNTLARPRKKRMRRPIP